jgi:hypothetical protein
MNRTIDTINGLNPFLLPEPETIDQGDSIKKQIVNINLYAYKLAL